MKKALLGASVALCLSGTGIATIPAMAADPIKIGVVTTLTTGAAVLGNEVADAATLAVENLGGEMAGRPVTLIIEDDGLNADGGRQKTEKLIRQDKVDFLTGYVWSHVLLASQKVARDGGTILISTNAGPSQMAGKGCHEKFFGMRGQGDLMSEALGEALTKNGVKKIYTMAPNYAAGKDVVAGMERTFGGEIVGRDFTKWGSDPQLDFSAELSKVAASDAEALFVFYPGRTATFLKQFDQSGLAKKVDLYSVYMLDQTVLPTLQGADLSVALGTTLVDYWYPQMDNAANAKFVETFKAKYDRLPSNYAAAAYDAINLIASAVAKTGGDLSDADKTVAALEAMDFDSTRGDIGLGSNHFVLDNFYLMKVGKDADGNWGVQDPQLVMAQPEDPYIGECSMK